MINPNNVPILEALTSLGIGGVIVKLVDTLAKGRAPKKDVMTAVAQAAELLMQGMREDLNALRNRLQQVEAGHQDCERRCRALTEDLREANQKIDGLKRQVARQINGPKSSPQ